MRRSKALLGTFVEITTSGGKQTAVDAAFKIIQTVHDLLSFHSIESELTRLNLAQGTEVLIHPITRRVLLLAKGMAKSSGHQFNPSTGASLVAAGILPDHGFGSRLASGTADDIIISTVGATIQGHILVTLDGIAKGYAVDLAVRELRKHGVRTGLVNAGGDLRAFGERIFPVTLQATGETHGLQNAALASSSNSPHPSARTPGSIVSESGFRPVGSWSVIAARAWRADALTKVAANSPPHEAAENVRKLGGRLVEIAIPAE